MPAFIYHPRYELKFGVHVFPVDKYRRLRDRLIAEDLVAPDEFIEPEPAADAELLLGACRVIKSSNSKGLRSW